MARKQALYVNMNPRRGGDGRTRRLSTSALVLSLVGAFLIIALAKVYLEQRSDQMGAQWEGVTKQLSVALKERDNLRLEREEYTKGSYILPKAEAMGLRATQPGQVRRLWQPTEDGASGTVVAANRLQ